MEVFMGGLTFKSNPRYKDKDIVARVTEIILGSMHQGRTFEVSRGRWDLGALNDWWLSKDPSKCEFRLDYRYGMDGSENMEALRRVIIWRLGLGVFNSQGTD